MRIFEQFIANYLINWQIRDYKNISTSLTVDTTDMMIPGIVCPEIIDNQLLTEYLWYLNLCTFKQFLDLNFVWQTAQE